MDIKAVILDFGGTLSDGALELVYGVGARVMAGKALATRLGKEFIETDALIEQTAGKSIPEIFRDDGEIRFREMEMEIIRNISAKENAVIACDC